MPALNFQSQWADAVYLGAQHANGFSCSIDLIPKRTTIRKPGRARPGQTLYLFTGQRTAVCRQLGTVICLGVTPVTFTETFGGLYLDNLLLQPDQCERLAWLDTAGTWGWTAFAKFFADTYGRRDFELIIW
jgi:hypothetical protein